MKLEPKGYEPSGQLKNCDRCGDTYRWIQLQIQDGKWICPPCADEIIRKKP